MFLSSRFCYAFMPTSGTLLAKTIPDSGNIGWSVCYAGPKASKVVATLLLLIDQG
jgi:hypothetical protein